MTEIRRKQRKEAKARKAYIEKMNKKESAVVKIRCDEGVGKHNTIEVNGMMLFVLDVISQDGDKHELKVCEYENS